MSSVHHSRHSIASKPQKETSLDCRESHDALEPEISYDQEFLLSAISEADDDINDAIEVQQALMAKLTAAQVGMYRLFDCVAKGGFAKVFRAKHEVRGTFHAIKRLDKRQFSSIKDVAQLGREIQVLKSEIR
ncbi:hypothetical protein MHU86_14696 [Fragilaria crotonensis]|nr:hypothetical protein MHU86_14696 [Fragilaria crotonensis]